eukprot:11304020-Alexandrium_andersonii.AAC.1
MPIKPEALSAAPKGRKSETNLPRHQVRWDRGALGLYVGPELMLTRSLGDRFPKAQGLLTRSKLE